MAAGSGSVCIAAIVASPVLLERRREKWRFGKYRVKRGINLFFEIDPPEKFRSKSLKPAEWKFSG
jgi:hypothetical protein